MISGPRRRTWVDVGENEVYALLSPGLARTIKLYKLDTVRALFGVTFATDVEVNDALDVGPPEQKSTNVYS